MNGDQETSTDPDDDTATVVDSREIYDDSYDGGYESGSYFAHAMGKDD